MGLLPIEQACTNSGTLCIGSLPIEQACTNFGTICMGLLPIEQACSNFFDHMYRPAANRTGLY